MAKDVVLRCTPEGGFSLTVDGVDFPWHVAADPAPSVGPVGSDGVPAVTVTILAERVQVDHQI